MKALIDVNPNINFCFDLKTVYEIMTKTFMRYGPIDQQNQPTDQPMDQRTNKTIDRDASKSLDTSKITICGLTIFFIEIKSTTISKHYSNHSTAYTTPSFSLI